MASRHRNEQPDGATEAAQTSRANTEVSAELLGQRIREVRLRSGMTARALAKASDVTPGFISQLEGGSVLPSIPTLLRIAGALGVRPSLLFDPEPPTPRLVRRRDRRVYEYPDRGFREAIISSDENGLIEVAWAEISAAGGTNGETFTHGSTSECVIVLRGEIEIYVEDESYVLRDGDCLTFPGSCRHGYDNRSGKLAQLLWVTTPVVY